MRDKQLGNATFDKLGLVNALTEAKVNLAKINGFIKDLLGSEFVDHADDGLIRILKRIGELSK